MSKGIPILGINSLTRILKLKPFGRNQHVRWDRKTDIMTTRLNRPWANSVKTYHIQIPSMIHTGGSFPVVPPYSGPL